MNGFKPFEFDFTKMMADYKVPGIDFTAMAAAQKKNLDAITKANQLAFEGMQAVVRRQTELLKQMMEEASGAVQQMMADGTPEQKIARQTDMIRQGFEKTLANMKEMSEMVAKSNTEAADVISKRVSESLTELKGAIDTTKNG